MGGRRFSEKAREALDGADGRPGAAEEAVDGAAMAPGKVKGSPDGAQESLDGVLAVGDRWGQASVPGSASAVGDRRGPGLAQRNAPAAGGTVGARRSLGPSSWRMARAGLAVLAVAGLVVAGCGLGESEPTQEPTSSSPRTAPTSEDIAVPEKPVLYLYPDQDSAKVSVDLDYAGQVTVTYPHAEPGDRWKVLAAADGTLTDARGRQYPYLFWEGKSPGEYDQDEGFVVVGGQAIPFLEEKLAKLGLSDREAADFVTYWAPRLAENDYNLVTFATEQYSNDARYTFTDASGRQFEPDVFIRVFMVYRPADASTQVPEQDLEPAPQRRGFVAVEWGGSEQG